MTLTLPPATEARLRAVAAQRGLAPEETIDMLLAEAETSPDQVSLTASEQEEVLAALRASVEDYAAGRWVSLEDYEAQIQAEKQALSTQSLRQ